MDDYPSCAKQAARSFGRSQNRYVLLHVETSINRVCGETVNRTMFGGPDEVVEAGTRLRIDLAALAKNPKIVGENPENFDPYRKRLLKAKANVSPWLPSEIIWVWSNMYPPGAV